MTKYAWLILGTVLLQFNGMAAITVPGADSSDGTLHVTSSTAIDLSQADSGSWDDDNTANAGLGIYDSNKWAVVYKYSSVTIDSLATLTFSNHISRAPVVWLVDGDVTINGTVSLNGEGYLTSTTPTLAAPGPGGFRGGMGKYSTGVGASAGFGPGGGHTTVSTIGYGASHAETAVNSPAVYGNPSLVPLLGGSGGGGSGLDYGGGAGGGAILIACSGTITVNGIIMANGGAGYDRSYSNYDCGGGSGGGIRLIADAFVGSGTVEAQAGSGNYPGSLGRVRLERVTNNNTWTTIAPEPSVIGLTAGDSALLWPTATSPTVKILSIGGEAVSGDPLASFGTVGADVSLAQTNTIQVLIETENVEQASAVTVRLTPRANASYTEVLASVDLVTSTDPLVVQWTADVPVGDGYSAIQVHVVRP